MFGPIDTSLPSRFATFLPFGRVPFPPPLPGTQSRATHILRCVSRTHFRFHSSLNSHQMPIRLPTSANGWSPARRTRAALQNPPGQCQGPLSAPEPRPSLLEAKVRDVQVPRPSSFDQWRGTFPKRADPLIAASATWQSRGSLLGTAQQAPPFPRRRAKSLPTSAPLSAISHRVEVARSRPGRRCYILSVAHNTPRRAGRRSVRFPFRVLRSRTVTSPCLDRPRITANRRRIPRLACKNRPAASGSPKSAVAFAAEGGISGPLCGRAIASPSSMTDRRRVRRSSRTWRRRAIVGPRSCALERTGGHSAAVPFRQRAASPSTDVTDRSRSAFPPVLGGPATAGQGRPSASSHGAVAGRKPTQMCVTPFIPAFATWPTVQGRGVGVRWAQQFVTGCRSTFRQPRGEKPPPHTNGGGGRKCRAQTQLRRSPFTIR